jgi:hypothetical protein
MGSVAFHRRGVAGELLNEKASPHAGDSILSTNTKNEDEQNMDYGDLARPVPARRYEEKKPQGCEDSALRYRAFFRATKA